MQAGKCALATPPTSLHSDARSPRAQELTPTGLERLSTHHLAHGLGRRLHLPICDSCFLLKVHHELLFDFSVDREAAPHTRCRVRPSLPQIIDAPQALFLDNLEGLL